MIDALSERRTQRAQNNNWGPGSSIQRSIKQNDSECETAYWSFCSAGRISSKSPHDRLLQPDPGKTHAEQGGAHNWASPFFDRVAHSTSGPRRRNTTKQHAPPHSATHLNGACRCHPPVPVPPTSEWCHPPWNLTMVPGTQFRPHVQVPPTHFGQRAACAVAYGWADRPTPVPPTFAGPAASRLVSPLRRCGQNAAHESAQLWDEQPAGGKRVVARHRLQVMTPNKTKLSDHFRVE